MRTSVGMASGGRSAGPRRWAAVLAWLLLALLLLCLVPITWIDHLLRQAGRPELVILSASGIPYVLSALSAATIGALVANRRPHHPVGWLLLALALSVAVDGVANGYAAYGAGRGEDFSYPLLGPALTRPIRWDIITQNYDIMMKYATAIRLRTASTEALLRRFTSETTHPAYAAMPAGRRRYCGAWSTCPEFRDRRWTG